jgi:hypothetical protein
MKRKEAFLVIDVLTKEIRALGSDGDSKSSNLLLKLVP